MTLASLVLKKCTPGQRFYINASFDIRDANNDESDNDDNVDNDDSVDNVDNDDSVDNDNSDSTNLLPSTIFLVDTSTLSSPIVSSCVDLEC